MITSKRSFGVEMEMGFPDEISKEEAIMETPREFGHHPDGSLRDYGVPYNTELVSPILNGEKAVNKLRRACSIMSDNGADATHIACAMHVHIDLRDQKDKIITIKPNKPEGVKKSDIVLVPKGIKLNDKAKNDLLFFPNRDSNRAYCCFEYGYYAHLYDGKNHYALTEDDTDMDDYLTYLNNMDVTKTSQERMESDLAFMQDIIDKIEWEYLVRVDNPNSVKNIKTIWSFYHVFDRVFNLMVADSRKDNNTYCQHISSLYELSDIVACNSIEDIAKVWYKVPNINQARQRFSNRYDDSRYQNVNLHSYFDGRGTIEFRSHGGTIDYKKIILWTMLHQHIIDSIIEDKIQLNSFVNINCSDNNDLIDEFFKVTKLPLKLEKYVRRSIMFFSHYQLKYPV